MYGIQSDAAMLTGIPKPYCSATACCLMGGAPCRQWQHPVVPDCTDHGCTYGALIPVSASMCTGTPLAGGILSLYSS